MEPGDKIGKYVLESRVGEGGMAEVWLSHDPDLGIPVAIKTLFPHLRESNPIFVQRFMQEAGHAARLNHPNVARIYAAGCENDVHYMVMEYLPGGTAETLIGDPPDKEMLGRIRTMVIGAANGLTAAAQAGIVHRDVKPANILFDAQGTAKLADLGIGKGLSSGEAENRSNSLTMTGHVVGTPYYMAPEQATGAKYVDVRSDIYALGATWYHLATGTVPFDGETSVGIMLRHVQDERPDARELNKDIPASDAAIIQKMMACDPNDRFQTPEELLVALKNGFKTPGKGGLSPLAIGLVAALVSALLLALYFWRAEAPPTPAPEALPMAAPIEPGAPSNAAPADPVAAPSPAPPAPPTVASQTELPAPPAFDSEDPLLQPLEGMVVIRPGHFRMGADDADDAGHGEPYSPQHLVQISQLFQIAATPVTKTAYARFCHAAAYETTAERQGRALHYGPDGWKTVPGANWRTGSSAHNHPVVDVSWADAMAFCAWLTERDRAENRIPADCAYRLPTEAEWEYACRAGTTTRFSFGSNLTDFAKFANCRDQASGLPEGSLWFERTSTENDGFATQAPVASYQPNPWGLYDTHGNVWEWCLDGPRTYDSNAATDPMGPQNDRRVFRGGSWDASPNLSRSAYRYAMDARRAANNLGFRIVLARQQ